MTKEELITRILTEDLHVEQIVFWAIMVFYLGISLISTIDTKEHPKHVNIAAVLSVTILALTIFLYDQILQRTLLYIMESSDKTAVTFYENMFIWYCFIKYVGLAVIFIWAGNSMPKDYLQLQRTDKKYGLFGIFSLFNHYFKNYFQYKYYIRRLIEEHKKQTI